MPIYQYQCTDCGHRQEALQKMSDAPLVDCPACGGHGLRKQITAASFRLKGTGWYATDFKNSGAAPVSNTSTASNSDAHDSSNAKQAKSSDQSAGAKS